MKLTVSTLPKMWLIDVDGTIFIHNSHLNGEDRLVPNFLSFYKQINTSDYIMLITAREEKYKKQTEDSLKKYGIKYDTILFNAPKGERILINDIKPQGLHTALAINTKRDKFKKITIDYDKR